MFLIDWLDARAGVRAVARVALQETIPGGARWRYVWGSTLVFVFALQVVTGVLLMTSYSPSATTAWSSVWYIQAELPHGWLIRGLHHFGSQAMVILLIVHILQVVLAGAFRKPRELNWWLGLGLAGCVLSLALTGYLLPWDQKGYWATKVATNILALTPVVGYGLQRVVTGGCEYGHATLTRLFTLHVFVLPATLIAALVCHIALLRRHGVTVSPAAGTRSAGRFWPDQVWRDSVACAAVFGVLLSVAWYTWHVAGSSLLDAPADPTSGYPGRPEWYFLFLFQFLKSFEGPVLEVLGAIVVPGVLVAAWASLPLLDRIMRAEVAHRLGVGFVVSCLLGAAYLTGAAVRDDQPPPAEVVAAVRARQQRGEALTADDRRVLGALTFNRQRAEATRVARRAFELAARQGVPPEGPDTLLADDPVVRGPALFAAHCAACHRFDGHDGMGYVPWEPATASDLSGFATATWIRGLLSDPLADGYFGRVLTREGEPAHTRMAAWIAERFEENESADDRRALVEELEAVAAYLEDESRHPGRWAGIAGDEGDKPAGADPVADTAQIVWGRQVFMTECNACHTYRGSLQGRQPAVEMYGYGSVDWIERMIADPGHESRYPDTGAVQAPMPAFERVLDGRDRRLIAEWIHGRRRRGSHASPRRAACIRCLPDDERAVRGPDATTVRRPSDARPARSRHRRGA